MQAVTAVAVMARKNAAVFRTLGANFFQMLCSESTALIVLILLLKPRRSMLALIQAFTFI